MRPNEQRCQESFVLTEDVVVDGHKRKWMKLVLGHSGIETTRTFRTWDSDKEDGGFTLISFILRVFVTFVGPPLCSFGF